LHTQNLNQPSEKSSHGGHGYTDDFQPLITSLIPEFMVIHSWRAKQSSISVNFSVNTVATGRDLLLPGKHAGTRPTCTVGRE
jgi:hypothetical protein